MNSDVKLMLDINEPFAAGFLEFKDGPLAATYCRAYRRYYESHPIVYKEGAPLFPAGNTTADADYAVKSCYARQYYVNWQNLKEKSPEAEEIFREFSSRYHYPGEWNHSMLNYRRILAEGINRYEERLLALKDSDFRSALLDLIEGIRNYHRRAIDELPALGAPKELIEALERVPFMPARTVYEAMVSLNFCLSLDGWDNVGRIDSILAPYHKGEDIRPYLRCMMESIQQNDRWSVTIGPEYNDISRQVLEASIGLARPMIQLRLTKDIPKDLWELAVKRILEGGGQPSIYNEDEIQKRLLRRLPQLTKVDSMEFAGGGCTETAFEGMSYTGATDTDLCVLKVFENYLYEYLPTTSTFTDFYEGFMSRLQEKQKEQVSGINEYYNERAKTCFAPIRTLFTDDCIDNESGWFQGGARYSFSNLSDSGIPNTIDSLLAVKHLVYDKKKYSPSRFLELLRNEDEAFFQELKGCPCYGVCDKEADDLANDLTRRFYEFYPKQKLDIGSGYFPTVHQFSRHIGIGKQVGPTPDGRRCGAPVADSLAAVNGKAVKGPSIMLTSAARYEQKDAYGMAVLNLSITKNYSSDLLYALVDGYFTLGGTQIQFTVADRETLLEARKNADKHRDLVVRVGGYSEYFYKLSDPLKDAVIARTIF